MNLVASSLPQCCADDVPCALPYDLIAGLDRVPAFFFGAMPPGAANAGLQGHYALHDRTADETVKEVCSYMTEFECSAA